MAKGQLVHYGKLLQAGMIQEERNASYVMKILGITDFRTFEKRLEDAKFSYDQLRNLKNNNLI
jgi:hypothetical protein